VRDGLGTVKPGLTVPDRIGILGGAFNPVHRWHLRIALAARRRLRLDRVLLIPTRISPHKPARDVAPARHRLRMLELSARRHAGLVVCDAELRRRGPSYSVDTMRALRRAHPRAEWFLLIGADNARSLSSWRRVDLLAEWVTFVAVDRPAYRWNPPRIPGIRIVRLPIPQRRLSSSDIRRRVRAGRPIARMVPPGVEDYIIHHRLYGSGS
jgi:nicotinate-nucleotide adenylyltransferase